jgi:hypothetical protein
LGVKQLAEVLDERQQAAARVACRLGPVGLDDAGADGAADLNESLQAAFDDSLALVERCPLIDG